MSGIQEALEKVAVGDPAAIASFGMERRLSSGRRSQSADVFEWEQRLLLTGQGLARTVSHRSLGDRGGEETGTYQTVFPQDFVQRTAAAVLTSGILQYDPGHIEPGDMMIRYRFGALGEVRECFLSMDQVPGPEAIRIFERVITRMDVEVRKFPLRTLRLECDLPDIPKAGRRTRIPATLRLVNRGIQGHWILNPAAMQPDGVLERRYVTWARRQTPQPGITPLPSVFVFGPLEPSPVEKDPDKTMLWLAPEATVEVPCTAMVNFPEPGEYFFKSAYSTFAGEQTYQGQARWIGAAFSQAQTLTVRG
ncbi:hypothetical protein F183_A02570 [Bryobacterales bacterium F-183]|nr:hypothetical protein F183_A02570 [Bryobacterales bacterium F-183]